MTAGNRCPRRFISSPYQEMLESNFVPGPDGRPAPQSPQAAQEARDLWEIRNIQALQELQLHDEQLHDEQLQDQYTHDQYTHDQYTHDQCTQDQYAQDQYAQDSYAQDQHNQDRPIQDPQLQEQQGFSDPRIADLNAQIKAWQDLQTRLLLIQKNLRSPRRPSVPFQNLQSSVSSPLMQSAHARQPMSLQQQFGQPTRLQSLPVQPTQAQHSPLSPREQWRNRPDTQLALACAARDLERRIEAHKEKRRQKRQEQKAASQAAPQAASAAKAVAQTLQSSVNPSSTPQSPTSVAECSSGNLNPSEKLTSPPSSVISQAPASPSQLAFQRQLQQAPPQRNQRAQSEPVAVLDESTWLRSQLTGDFDFQALLPEMSQQPVEPQHAFPLTGTPNENTDGWSDITPLATDNGMFFLGSEENPEFVGSESYNGRQ